MARRKHSRKSSGFGMGRLLTTKNILYTVGGAFVASKFLNMDPKLGAAAGGLLGAGPIGAMVGFVAGPSINNVVGGVLGGSSGGAMY